MSPKITVVGVGGAGGNAVNNMISSGLEGCSFVVCNTDAQALEGSLCEDRIQLGTHVTGGLGAGARPEVGKKAAEESLDDVMGYLDGSNMVFVTAGMGGGTGTGAAPVIAKACRDSGILTVGVVTKPFHFEGSNRMRMAEAGIAEMQQYVDTLIVIPNQNLFRVANERTTFAEAFRMADSVLQSGVRGVTDLMVMPGLINLDFADIRSAMLEMGKAMMGTGEAEGERRAIEAAEAAINNPLLDDVTMKGARGVIINVTGGADMTLFEVDEACNRIRDEVDPNANIIFGSTFDDKLEGRMRVSVVATGIDAESMQKQPPQTQTGSGVRVMSAGKIPGTQTAALPPERARPHTDTIHAATMAARANLPGRPPMTPMAPTYPASSYTPVPVTAKVPEPEAADMFEQPEFVQPQSQTAPSNRAYMHQGYFIPPAPVVPEPQDVPPYMQSTYAPSLAPRAPMTPGAMQAQGVQQPIIPQPALVLRPPALPQAQPAAEAEQRRKPPSLFERITSGVRGRTSSGDQAPVRDTYQSTPGGGSMGGLAARRMENPAQGTLNIDAPAAPPRQKPAMDTDLDIPAFLRRQAN